MTLAERYPWATPAQLECIQLAADLLGGEHRLPRGNCKGVQEWGLGIAVHLRMGMATFDVDKLTRLVFLAHDRCIRAELEGAAPGCLRLLLHRRQRRDGRFWQVHPELETALERHRKHYPRSP